MSRARTPVGRPAPPTPAGATPAARPKRTAAKPRSAKPPARGPTVPRGVTVAAVAVPPPRAVPAAKPRRAPAKVGGPVGAQYLAESERPWASLLFVLPLILVYEAYAMGLIGGGGEGGSGGAFPRGEGHITAFVLIDELFTVFKASGRHLPAIGLVGMLLSAQLVRRDPWKVSPRTLAGMAGESLFWAAPLVVLGCAFSRMVPLSVPGPAQRLVILSIGAGLYEEMLFRLIGVSVLVLVLQHALGLKARLVYPTVLIGLGLLFSIYHYLSPYETFAWRPFLFRTAAGCYLGTLYVLRGFGVTAASHAVYDMAVGALLAA